MNDRVDIPTGTETGVPYQDAKGSGFAATLLFLHIALIGYLAYAGQYVVRNYGNRVFLDSELSWQLLFPALFAASSFLPSDGSVSYTHLTLPTIYSV